MDRDDAMTVLRDAERRGAAVRAGGRWPVTLLLVWGAVTLVVEPSFALLADRPWAMAFPMAIVAIFATWAGVYAKRQRVAARGFTRRYLTTVAAWAALHAGYVALFAGAGLRDAWFVVLAALVVAAPLFAGAYVESKRP